MSLNRTVIPDLFASATPLRLEMPDAEVVYWPGVDLGMAPHLLLKELIEQTPWRSDIITLWGRQYPQPRLSAWYGDPGARYTYSGLSLEPLPWTDLLAALRARVEALVGASFNSVLLNYYRDHRDSMGMHSDDEPELGGQPIIASLSLGARRALVFKHKLRKDLKPVQVPLDSGSLLLMKGETQHKWKHGINKLQQPCGPRVNLTFRRILAVPR
jgi:alkylated DNA repair dioxygenase AlkB